MKRIQILGCSGSGKSTLAKRLHLVTKLPLFHLDQYFFNSNWEEPNREEWNQKVKQISEKDHWIIDGNYGSTLERRIEKADTVIFLDFSTIKCLYRVTKRMLINYGKTRSDMAENCPERFDLNFYKYVLTYNSKKKDKIFLLLSKHNKKDKTIVLKNDKEISFFLTKIGVKNILTNKD